MDLLPVVAVVVEQLTLHKLDMFMKMPVVVMLAVVMVVIKDLLVAMQQIILEVEEVEHQHIILGPGQMLLHLTEREEMVDLE